MKKNLYITAALIASISFGGYAEPSCCEVPGPAGAGVHTDASLFQVESVWQNHLGQTGPLSQLKGRIQVMALVYTSCQYACPRILVDLKAIETALSEIGSEKLGICLVTMDPERDTVERFNGYAKDHGLNLERWSFLRGSDGDILELANLLGVKYKKLPDGEISHSNVITLLNEEGEIVFQLNGLGAPTGEIVAKARELVGK